MSKVKFVLNKKGVSELLLCEEMKEILEEYGNAALNRCDEGYDYKLDVGAGKKRLHANIRADGYKAYYHNLKSNTLLKALKGQ
jgi:hypothetical protein